MKRVLIIVAFLCISANFTVTSSKDFTPEQNKLYDEILVFLKEEGVIASVGDDGDIKFRYSGHLYVISVSDSDDNPLFINMYQAYDYPNNYSIDELLLATKALNLYKGVKVTCYDNYFKIGADMYLRSAELFKSSFYKLVSQIDNARDDVLAECESVSKKTDSPSINLPFLISGIEVANTEKDGTIITDFGDSINRRDTKYLCPRITIDPITSGTYTVFVRLYKNNVLVNRSPISPVDYTYEHDITVNGTSGQLIRLAGWGIDKLGTWKKGSYRFEVWYDNICLGSKSFEIL